MSNYHIPVLREECIENLRILAGGNYADCTLGGGGHSLAIAEKLFPESTDMDCHAPAGLAMTGESAGMDCHAPSVLAMTGKNAVLHCFDRDPEAIAEAKKTLAKFGNGIVFHNSAFSNLGAEVPPRSLNGILYDLGVSSHQIDAGRGFSFANAEKNTPLDMRMNASEGESAQGYLKRVSQNELARALSENSDLEKANRLAARILQGVATCAAENRDITAADLNSAIEEIYPNRREQWNALKARVFQAVRMEVNSEIAEIRESVKSAVECLVEGGRLCLITYHSKEAQAVKETLSILEKECTCPPKMPVCVCGGNNRKIRRVTKKPILPSAEEIRKNPRARSAALRVYERIKEGA